MISIRALWEQMEELIDLLDLVRSVQQGEGVPLNYALSLYGLRLLKATFSLWNTTSKDQPISEMLTRGVA